MAVGGRAAAEGRAKRTAVALREKAEREGAESMVDGALPAERLADPRVLDRIRRGSVELIGVKVEKDGVVSGNQVVPGNCAPNPTNDEFRRPTRIEPAGLGRRSVALHPPTTYHDCETDCESCCLVTTAWLPPFPPVLLFLRIAMRRMIWRTLLQSASLQGSAPSSAPSL